MQEVKYYVPKIEEFCVGFEYELRQAGIWQKEKVQRNDCFCDLQGEGIRVKYLDKEDILNCKFKFQCSDAFGQLIFKRGSFELTFYPPNPTFIEIDNSDKNFTRFIGRIKNKIELKKLLKQLEIDGTN